MTEVATLIGISAVVFVSTNIDDLFVLIGFFADRRYHATSVVIGQFAGIGALVAVSVLASLVSLVLPPPQVGLLGVLPIWIGARRLFDLGGSDDEASAPPGGASATAQIASVAAVTIANGGDNLAVYVPWFATQRAGRIAVAVAVFAAATALWLAIGHWLVHHRTAGAVIRRHGRLALPFVLIALGISILYEAGSFGLLG